MADESRWKNTNFKSLKPGAHIHLIGVCGTAMASLAGLLKDQGFKVTGSDQNAYPPMSTQLEEIGIEIKEGYSAANLEPRPDLAVVGNVITRQHEEARALLNSDIPYTSLPMAMGEYAIADRQSVVVTGTHGKTTTTSLMAWMAETCGLKPGFLIGGIPKNFQRSFKNPQGNVFVIEGDEYDTAFFDKVPKFIHYRPKFVILTSIEFDHADIYRDLDHVMEAFCQLVELIPEDGILVANSDSESVRQVAQKCRGKVVTYGRESGDYTYSSGNGRLVIGHSAETTEIPFSFYGEYNLANATAAFALASEMGWPRDKVTQAVQSFTGVKRRQEIIGAPNDITIIEDFAHHPTAVGMTIKAVQSHFAGRQVISVFEPRSATSRRKVFQAAYAEALGEAQKVLLAKPFNQSKIPEDQRFSSDLLKAQLAERGVSCEVLDTADEIVSRLKDLASPGDVILIMSNGGFDGLYSKLLKTLA